MVGRFEEFMVTMRGMGYAPNTLNYYGTVRNTLNWFLDSVGKSKLPVSEWDMARHQQFVGYPREVQGLVNNAVFSTIEDMKAFFRHLESERGEKLALDLTKAQLRYSDPVKIYLSADDLAVLASAMLPAWMVPVRDVFLFCCYTGLRYSDVAALHGGNLHALGADGSGGRVLRLT